MENRTLFPNRTSRPSYSPRVDWVERCRAENIAVGGGVRALHRWVGGEDVVIPPPRDHRGGEEEEEEGARMETVADAMEREEVRDGQDGADRVRIEKKDLRNIVVLRVLRDIMY